MERRLKVKTAPEDFDDLETAEAEMGTVKLALINARCMDYEVLRLMMDRHTLRAITLRRKWMDIFRKYPAITSAGFPIMDYIDRSISVNFTPPHEVAEA